MPYYNRDPKKDHSFDNHPFGKKASEGRSRWGGKPLRPPDEGGNECPLTEAFLRPEGQDLPKTALEKSSPGPEQQMFCKRRPVLVVSMAVEGQMTTMEGEGHKRQRQAA